MELKKLICMFLLFATVTTFGACGQTEKPQDTIVEAEPDPGPQPTNEPPATPQEAFSVNEEAEIEITGAWDGYTELDFKSFFTKGITNLCASIEEVTLEKCEIFAVEGWLCKDLLDESTVAEGNKAVTYVVYLTQKYEDKTLDVGYKFYMERTPDGILMAKGAENFTSGMGYGDVYEEEQVNGMLAELRDAI